MLFLLFQALTAVAFFGIKFIEPIEHNTLIDFHCNDGVSDLRYCSPNGTTLDDCLAGALTREPTNETMNDTMTCALKCNVTGPWMAEAICRNWQNLSDMSKCDLNRQTYNLNVDIEMRQIERLSECLAFEVHSGYILENDEKYIISCPHNANATQFFSSHCEGRCTNHIVMQATTTQALSNSSVLNLYQFWLFFWLLVLSWAGMAAVVSLGDAICFQLLGEQHNLYGNQRLWGAVGWGVFSLLAGIMVDEMSRGQVFKDYSGIFYMMVVLIAFDLLFSSRIEIFKDIGVLFLSPAILIFFVWCIVVGLCTALIWNFLFWHLEVLADADTSCNQNEWMKTLQGLAMGIQCFGGELPFFFLSGWVLKKIGHINAMSLVLLFFGIRFMLYSVLTNPWWVLPIELMQGITFGIFYSTMASYASLVAPVGAEATLQGLVGAIFEGIGVSAGSFIGGYLMESVGGSQTFRLFSYMALLFFVIHVAVQKLMEKYPCGSACGIAFMLIVIDYGTTLRYTTPVDALTMLTDDDHMPDESNYGR